MSNTERRSDSQRSLYPVLDHNTTSPSNIYQSEDVYATIISNHLLMEWFKPWLPKTHNHERTNYTRDFSRIRPASVLALDILANRTFEMSDPTNEFYKVCFRVLSSGGYVRVKQLFKKEEPWNGVYKAYDITLEGNVVKWTFDEALGPAIEEWDAKTNGSLPPPLMIPKPKKR